MRSIEFHGRSLESIRKFPLKVKREIGYQLDRLQRELNPLGWKPMKTGKTAKVDIERAKAALRRVIKSQEK